MPTDNTNFKHTTRTDYHVEQILQFFESADVKNAEERAKRNAAEQVNKEDERIWAWYRDSRSNLTQKQARDRAQTTDYPSKYQLTQSSISRKISKLDDAMLTQPVSHLNMEEPDEWSEDERVGLFAQQEYEQFKQYRLTALLDCWRSLLATFIIDKAALNVFSDGEQPTPEWAQDRFPAIDPNIGRELYKKKGVDVELHDPQRREAETAAD